MPKRDKDRRDKDPAHRTQPLPTEPPRFQGAQESYESLLMRGLWGGAGLNDQRASALAFIAWTGSLLEGVDDEASEQIESWLRAYRQPATRIVLGRTPDGDLALQVYSESPASPVHWLPKEAADLARAVGEQDLRFDLERIILPMLVDTAQEAVRQGFLRPKARTLSSSMGSL